MDADDLARGRALEAAERACRNVGFAGTARLPATDLALLTGTCRRLAAALLDAAERAARLEAALQQIGKHAASEYRMGVRGIQHAEEILLDILDSARAALEQPKGAGGA